MEKKPKTPGEENSTRRTVTYIDGNGEKNTGTVSVTPQELYLRQLERARADNAAEAERTVQQAEQNAEKQLSSLRDEYAAVNKELYRDYMQDKKTLPQTMAAQGYSGGLTESGQLKLETAYGEALNENERERLRQEGEIRTARDQQVRTAGTEALKADNEAWEDYYKQLAALAEQEYTTELTDARNRAKTMAENGDIEGYLSLGYTEEEARYLIRLWLIDNPDYEAVWRGYDRSGSGKK